MSFNIVNGVASTIDPEFGFVKILNQEGYPPNPRSFTSGDHQFKFMRLIESRVNINNKDNVLIIHTDYSMTVSVSSASTTYPSGKNLFLCGNEKVSIVSEGELNLLFINKEYYKSIEHKIALIKKIPCEDLISDLFRSINLENGGMYQCRAVANLVAALIDKVEFSSDYSRIVGYLRKHFRDALTIKYMAKEIGMSVRKVQYILSGNNTSFADLLNSLRVENLTALISTNPRMSINCLSKLSGFSSAASANRAFEKINKVKIAVYKKQLLVVQISSTNRVLQDNSPLLQAC